MYKDSTAYDDCHRAPAAMAAAASLAGSTGVTAMARSLGMGWQYVQVGMPPSTIRLYSAVRTDVAPNPPPPPPPPPPPTPSHSQLSSGPLPPPAVAAPEVSADM